MRRVAPLRFAAFREPGLIPAHVSKVILLWRAVKPGTEPGQCRSAEPQVQNIPHRFYRVGWSCSGGKSITAANRSPRVLMRSSRKPNSSMTAW